MKETEDKIETIVAIQKTGKRGMTGMTKQSQNNLENIHDKKDAEFFRENGAKGAMVARQRRLFRDIFAEILTEEKQTVIAQQFVDAITDENVQLKTRLQIFETVLKILGEGDEHLTSGEFNALSQHIKLEIV